MGERFPTTQWSQVLTARDGTDVSARHALEQHFVSHERDRTRALRRGGDAQTRQPADGGKSGEALLSEGAPIAPTSSSPDGSTLGLARVTPTAVVESRFQWLATKVTFEHALSWGKPRPVFQTQSIGSWGDPATSQRTASGRSWPRERENRTVPGFTSSTTGSRS